MTPYIDLVFPKHLAGDDLEIIQPASIDTPGRVRLLHARRGTQLAQEPPTWQLNSHNGGGFLGYLAEGGEPLPPFQDTYWLEEQNAPPT